MNLSQLFAAARLHVWRPIYESAQGRSSHWSAVRKQHLAKHPACAVCGGSRLVQVHHIKPFHLHPELELEPSNLITLCEHSEVLGCNCHLVFGHACNWKAFVAQVVSNAKELLPQVRRARGL